MENLLLAIYYLLWSNLSYFFNDEMYLTCFLLYSAQLLQAYLTFSSEYMLKVNVNIKLFIIQDSVFTIHCALLCLVTAVNMFLCIIHFHLIACSNVSPFLIKYNSYLCWLTFRCIFYFFLFFLFS